VLAVESGHYRMEFHLGTRLHADEGAHIVGGDLLFSCVYGRGE